MVNCALVAQHAERKLLCGGMQRRGEVHGCIGVGHRAGVAVSRTASAARTARVAHDYYMVNWLSLWRLVRLFVCLWSGRKEEGKGGGGGECGSRTAAADYIIATP